MIGLAMSTYNGEKYIEEQLESIKKQSMKVDHVIIIDDCSDDETYKIIKKFTENNGLNWIVQQNSKNLGWKSNFLKIIEMLEDDYIFFCDQDDIWDKDKVKKSIEAMKKKDADVLCTNYKLFYAEKNASRVLEKENRKQKQNGKIEKITQERKNFYIRRPGCSMCIQKRLLEKNKDFIKLSYPHDAIFWKLAFLENSLYILNEPLLLWRRHSNNASTRKHHDFGKRKNNVYQEFLFSIKLMEKYKENVITKEFYNFAWLRKELFDTKKIIYWIKLFKYKKYYVSFKSYVGDLYLCIKN